MSYNSTNFNLKKWKLTLPLDYDGGTDGQAQEVKALTNYESKYFYDGPDGAMVFMATTTGATTVGSHYPRSELREMTGSGKEAAWKLSEGGVMTATLKVDKVPTLDDGTKGRVIVGQIHGEEKELIRIYWSNNSLDFTNDQCGGDNKPVKHFFKDALGNAPNIALGETFSYKIDAHGSTLKVDVFADGKTYTSTSMINSVWLTDKFYFKAGAYLCVNEESGAGTGQVSFYALDYSHKAGYGLDGLEPALAGSTVGTHNVETINGTASGESLYGRGGNDKMYGNDGNDKLYGSAGDDLLDGGRGNDTLLGGAGRDTLVGGAGQDTLKGGQGFDKLTGGTGADTFVMESLDVHDILTDFNPAEDTLSFGGLLGANSTAHLALTTQGKIGFYIDLDGAASAFKKTLAVTFEGTSTVTLLNSVTDILT